MNYAIFFSCILLVYLWTPHFGYNGFLIQRRDSFFKMVLELPLFFFKGKKKRNKTQNVTTNRKSGSKEKPSLDPGVRLLIGKVW